MASKKLLQKKTQLFGRVFEKGTLADARQLVQSRFKYPEEYKKMQQSYKPGSVSYVNRIPIIFLSGLPPGRSG